MPDLPEYLFVYGSLMGGIQSKIARLLHGHSDFIGAATTRGCLYDLGSYPGLVLDEKAAKVEGHIFRLHEAKVLLSYLDEYEGIVPDNALNNEYERQLIPVDLAGKTLVCWAYIYQLAIKDLPIIPFENYLDYLKNQKGHQRFLDQV